MRVAGVRLDGQHEVIFCNAGELNLAVGNLVKLSTNDLLIARVVVVPELLEVAQLDSTLPLIVEVVNFLAEKNVVPVEPAKINPVCQQQPCCVEWLTQFSGSSARLTPCCLDKEAVVANGQPLCALESKQSK